MRFVLLLLSVFGAFADDTTVTVVPAPSEEETKALTEKEILRLKLSLCDAPESGMDVWRAVDRQETRFWQAIEHFDRAQADGDVVVSAGNVPVRGDKRKSRRNEDQGDERPGALVRLTDKARERLCGPVIDWQKLLLDFAELVLGRPADELTYDQGRIYPADVVARVRAMHEKHDLRGASLAVFGDDDLLSVVAAMTGLPARIVVFEADARLTGYIHKLAAAQQWTPELSTETYDFREAFPDQYRAQFDVFTCDGVESLIGIEVTLSRAAEALRGPGSAGYFGLTTKEASKNAWRFVQQQLLSMHFYMSDIVDRFSTYEECVHATYPRVRATFGNVPESIRCSFDFYRSALYRVEALKTPEPTIRGKANVTIEEFLGHTEKDSLVWLGNVDKSIAELLPVELRDIESYPDYPSFEAAVERWAEEHPDRIDELGPAKEVLMDDDDATVYRSLNGDDAQGSLSGRASNWNSLDGLNEKYDKYRSKVVQWIDDEDDEDDAYDEYDDVPRKKSKKKKKSKKSKGKEKKKKKKSKKKKAAKDEL